MTEATTTLTRAGTSGRLVDKFEAFDLTPMPAALVDAPLIAECYTSLECRRVDIPKPDSG